MDEGDGLRSAEQKLKEAIHGSMEEEDLKWKQRAKEEWLCNGGRNTRYYHACATQRKLRNKVEQIRDETGYLCTTQEEIEDAFVRYYRGLFTSSKPQNMERCISAIGSNVSAEMNARLTATFTKEELKWALDQRAPLKAPGPDGFTTDFYHKH